MEQSTSTSKQDIKIIVSSFLIVAGLFSLMFHMILFPILGVIIGIPWIGAGILSVIKNRRSQFRVCSPGHEWQESCR